MRVIGLDIHRAFAEAVAWDDGQLKRLGRIGAAEALFGRSSRWLQVAARDDLKWKGERRSFAAGRVFLSEAK